MNKKKIFITGCLGFIGFHLSKKLLENDYEVIGIDNFYNNLLSQSENLKDLSIYKNFKFYKDDIRTTKLIEQYKPYKVIHLAGLAGVRESINNPDLYYDINVNGFINLIEQCKEVESFIYASSSSVYGNTQDLPYKENQILDKCLSPYAETKKLTEKLALEYYDNYGIKSIGFRFFSVFGPRGRKNMAPYLFLNNVYNSLPIIKYGDGTSTRDYTYIDDIIDGIIKAIHNENICCEIINLGASYPISLNFLIESVENITGKKAIINNLEKHYCDVDNTWSDNTKAINLLNYSPKNKFYDGLLKTFDYFFG